MSTPANALDVTQAGLVRFDGIATFTGVTVTNHDVLVGSTSNGITSVGPGSSGQLLQSKGASSDPAYTTATYPSTAGTAGNVLTSDGTNFVSTTPSTAAGYTLGMLYDNGTGIAASSTYYLSPFNGFDITGHGTAGKRIYFPEAGTITAVYGTIVNVGSNAGAGSSTLTIRKNNTSNTTITSSLSLASADNTFNNSALNIAVSAGDYVEVFITTPAFVPGTISSTFSFTILVT